MVGTVQRIARRPEKVALCNGTVCKGQIRQTQPSIPGGRLIEYQLDCMAGVRRGVFSCVWWQVTLRDPIMAGDVP